METPDVRTSDHETLVRLADLSARHAGGRPPLSPEFGWKMLLARLAEPAADFGTATRPGSPRHPRWTTVSLTAGFTIVASLLLVIGWQAGERGSNASLATLSARSSVYTTSKGERATIMLPDSTVVMLNVASRLEVPANYAAGQRTVRLIGEALFTVTHHSEIPFTIHTDASTTRVLGTSFSVRQYVTDSVASIAVRDGKVMVHHTVLTAGQRVMVSRNGTGPVQRTDVNPFLFEQGILALPSMPLSAAIPELSRWYDADIQLADPAVANERIEGQFPTGSLADLIERLEWTFNLRVVRNGRTITIYQRGV